MEGKAEMLSILGRLLRKAQPRECGAWQHEGRDSLKGQEEVGRIGAARATQGMKVSLASFSF